MDQMDEGPMSVLNDHQPMGEPARAAAQPQSPSRENHGGLASAVRVDPRKLWSGGAASAAVAGLVALVGVLVTWGLFSLPVLAPSQDGAYGDVSTTVLVLLAAAAALAATGLVHLLIANTPRPFLFFGWIVTLVTTLVVVYPSSTTASLVAASPLRRARETAQPTADRAGLIVTTDRCFIDRDYGPWTGTPKGTVAAQWGSVDAAPGVEPRSAVRDRAVRGLMMLAGRFPGASVVVVSHDAVNQEVLAALDPGLGDPDDIEQDNGCFNVLQRTAAGMVVLSVNEHPDGT